jgi:hypothetical protein
MHAGILSCYIDKVPKLQEMAILVELKVVMVYLSTWNLSLVTVDLPSFLGRFVMFCVLVRRHERMVWILSRLVMVYSEGRLPLLIFLRIVCGWRSFMYCLCVEMECPCVPPAVVFLRGVIQYGSLESLDLLNHFLMFSSLSYCCSWRGLISSVGVGRCLCYLFMSLTSSLSSNVRSSMCGVEAHCGVNAGLALQISGWAAWLVFH